ncbi:tumor necrosis factor receptor superfamily member 5 [Nematolebias whitei]|uniref:tumor necrosis factor receptor superfamily member 5 n=1 Tax=Nematolebias whitei TaxID=451745 RepID=UPI00189A111B|nr:tumor necrosis factor receptor superfamily member 5 [Nematolebias whitei]
MSVKLFPCLLFTSVVVLSSAQPAPDLSCDPATEYAKDGQCCKLCRPGKRMTVLSSCTDPVCDDCGLNEYQDNYNKEVKCKRQPYCDPNKNFEVAVIESKTERTTCLCKQGFHCSSQQCITCVLDRSCEPGDELVLEGNRTHDTVCRSCPKETFSSTRNSKCVKWTECKEGFHVVQNGTDRADMVCEANSRTHVIIAGVVVALVLVTSTLGILVYKYLNKSRYRGGKIHGKSLVEEVGPEPFHSIIGVPEEIDAEEMLPSEDHGITENGNWLAQEDGKLYKISHQESQMLHKLSSDSDSSRS